MWACPVVLNTCCRPYSACRVHEQVDNNYELRGIRAASPAVLEAIFRVADEALKRDMRNIIISSEGQSHMAVLRGHMFEGYGHRMLRQGCVACSMRRLTPRKPVAREQEQQQQHYTDHMETDGLGSTTTAAGSSAAAAAAVLDPADNDPLVEESHHVLCELVDNEQLQAIASQLDGLEGLQVSEGHEQLAVLQQLDLLAESLDKYELPPLTHTWDKPQLDLHGAKAMYWQPSSSVNPAIDAAVFWPNGDCDLLQYTVGHRHGIKHHPTARFLQRIDTEGRKVRMVFMVPPDVYERFSWQPWLNANGKVSLKPTKAVAGLEQYVVQLPVTQTPRSTADGSTGRQSTSG